ncbi:LytTR family DNA-binding domain-containing protein [Parapedobacter koreensis]|uniref:LytTr DNA-binding domain-containing protein n=1 Tax=Parapedobacter koreensis TaxID=332977 RepID=A0A1H7K1I8_9SPHI|nr:LytTR family DNA-binding domain-containing protein [Parapedobacter koreensis]SEK80632.1 hypothetical protein SAMN05421740_102749 [Parapedobacter koreensis]
MHKYVTTSFFRSLKHILVMTGLALVGAVLLYANGMGPQWPLLFSNRHYFSLFILIVGISLAAVSLVDYITGKLNGYAWANTSTSRRFWIQVALGIAGVGTLTYLFEGMVFEWLLNGMFRFSLDVMFALVFLLYMLLVNMAVLFIHGVLRLTPTGATPKNVYLEYLLTLDGKVAATNIRYCYHHKHKMNRVRLRDTVKHADPVMEESLDDAERQLDATEFMRIAPDVIIHQSAIVDGGRRLPNRNRLVRLVEPFDKIDMQGRVRKIGEIAISRRKVKQFDSWREEYRNRK